MARISFIIASVLMLLAVGEYFALQMFIKKVDKQKEKLVKCNQLVKHAKNILVIEKQNCEDKLALISKIKKETDRKNKELEKEFKKGDNEKDYKILATDKCGCYFDGNGWVFK